MMIQTTAQRIPSKPVTTVRVGGSPADAEFRDATQTAQTRYREAKAACKSRPSAERKSCLRDAKSELKTAQDWVLERQFKQVPGVVDLPPDIAPDPPWHLTFAQPLPQCRALCSHGRHVICIGNTLEIDLHVRQSPSRAGSGHQPRYFQV